MTDPIKVAAVAIAWLCVYLFMLIFSMIPTFRHLMEAVPYVALPFAFLVPWFVAIISYKIFKEGL